MFKCYSPPFTPLYPAPQNVPQKLAPICLAPFLRVSRMFRSPAEAREVLRVAARRLERLLMRTAADKAVTRAAAFCVAAEALQRRRARVRGVAAAVAVEAWAAPGRSFLARAASAQARVRSFAVAAVAEPGLVRVRPADVPAKQSTNLGRIRVRRAFGVAVTPPPVPIEEQFRNTQSVQLKCGVPDTCALISTQGEPPADVLVAVLLLSWEKVMLVPSKDPYGPMTMSSFA